MTKINKHTSDLIKMLDESAEIMEREENKTKVSDFNKKESRNRYSEDIINSFDDVSILMCEASLGQIDDELKNEFKNHVSLSFDKVSLQVKLEELDSLLETSSDFVEIITFVLKEGTVFNSKI